MYVICTCIYIDILIYRLLKVVEEKAQEEQQEEEQQQEEQVAGGVPAQSHENVTNTEVIYLIIISLLDNIDML